MVKSFKLVPRPLDKGPGPGKSNCDLVYMASFWRETNWFGPKKRALRRAHGLENQSVAHFFIKFFFLLLFSFTLATQNLWVWKTYYGLPILLATHELPYFWPILELTWLVLWILIWWLLKGVHFQHEMKVRKKKKKKKTPCKKKKKKRKKSIINIILSHVNHTFFNIEPSNRTPSLKTHSLYLRKKRFFKCEERFN